MSATDWHTLKVVAQGSNFSFYIDSTLEGSATSTGPASGTVGFAAWNLDADVQQTLEFTNLSVQSLP